MKCTACQMENIEGALFCEECGAKLETAIEQQETAANEAGAGALVFATSSGATLEIPSKDEVVIGREDPISEIFPDLDLTNYGGMDSGVSRKHAVIHRSGGGMTIEDMGSPNGSEVNGQRVHSQALVHGDVVKLGDAVFRFETKKP